MTKELLGRCGGLGQSRDGVFGGNVGRHAGVGAQPRHRRRVDDRATVRLRHLPQFVLEAEEHAGHIDIHDPVPILFGLLGERRGR